MINFPRSVVWKSPPTRPLHACVNNCTRHFRYAQRQENRNGSVVGSSLIGSAHSICIMHAEVDKLERQAPGDRRRPAIDGTVVAVVAAAGGLPFARAMGSDGPRGWKQEKVPVGGSSSRPNPLPSALTPSHLITFA